MSSTTQKLIPTIGFLAVTEHAEHGLFGGYLLLNASGRPLEFHCTAPVKANRAQEILYGPTLKPFLYGEQIGQTLIAKAKITPLLICTDNPSILAAREFCQTPLIWVLANQKGEPSPSVIASQPFSIGKNSATTAPGFADDEAAAIAAWKPYSDYLDLLEPFVRIREALEEAQRSARAA